MTEQPIVLTDPARELAELCGALEQLTDRAGETHLADNFDVKAWSPEFFQIVFTIVERCALLQRIVEDLELDDDLKAEVITHIGRVMDAFSAKSMKAAWKAHGNERIGPVHVGPIKAISGLVRQRVAYRKLSEEELAELQEEVAKLLEWLYDHQLSEQDFIRQALIDGLEHFQFRVTRLRWLGWGYTLDSLREVIAAYMLLERGIDPQASPDAQALLRKVGAVIKNVYEKVGVVKGVAETGDWLLRAYGAGSLVYQSNPQSIAGLLGAG